MARTVNKAVFFAGDLTKTTERFAGMASSLCRRHFGAENAMLIDGGDLLERRHLRFNDRPWTFFVHGAPSNRQHVPFLYDFSGGAVIVHIDFQGDPTIPPQTQPILGGITDVPIIHLVERREDNEVTRLHWILRQLGEINRKPIPAEVIEKALADKKALSRIMHTPTHMLAKAFDMA